MSSGTNIKMYTQLIDAERSFVQNIYTNESSCRKKLGTPDIFSKLSYSQSHSTIFYLYTSLLRILLENTGIQLIYEC